WRRDAAPFREPLVTRNLELVDELRQIAEDLGTTVTALAVGWVLAQPGVTGAIVGARRAAHVDGWAAGADLALGDDVLRRIDEAVTTTGAGSDEPPAPPSHIRATASDDPRSKEPA